MVALWRVDLYAKLRGDTAASLLPWEMPGDMHALLQGVVDDNDKTDFIGEAREAHLSKDICHKARGATALANPSGLLHLNF